MNSRLTNWLVLLVLLQLLAGCGRGWGDVSGTVRYQGKPLPKGTITFYDETNQAVTSPIADGKYTMPNKVAAGKVKVAVMLPMFIAMAGDRESAARMAAEQKNMPNLPAHYADAEKSGLDRTVKQGSQTIDFDL
ncbi:MAG TPA: hypothetical protein VH575_22620 [Gemmataceae bacterium]|jgi:hypothetical protein